MCYFFLFNLICLFIYSYHEVDCSGHVSIYYVDRTFLSLYEIVRHFFNIYFSSRSVNGISITFLSTFDLYRHSLSLAYNWQTFMFIWFLLYDSPIVIVKLIKTLMTFVVHFYPYIIYRYSLVYACH